MEQALKIKAAIAKAQSMVERMRGIAIILTRSPPDRGPKCRTALFIRLVFLQVFPRKPFTSMIAPSRATEVHWATRGCSCILRTRK